MTQNHTLSHTATPETLADMRNADGGVAAVGVAFLQRQIEIEHGRSIARLIEKHHSESGVVSGSRESNALRHAVNIALCPCDHDWEEAVSSQFSNEFVTDVSCSKCHMSGQKTNETGDVYWPAT